MSTMLGMLYLSVIGFWLYFNHITKNKVMKMSSFFMLYIHMLGALTLSVRYTQAGATIQDLNDLYLTIFNVNGYALFVIILMIMIVETERGMRMIRSLENYFGGGGFGKKKR